MFSLAATDLVIAPNIVNTIITYLFQWIIIDLFWPQNVQLIHPFYNKQYSYYQMYLKFSSLGTASIRQRKKDFYLNKR